MAYCSVADLVARFSETEIAQLTDVESRETVDDTVALAAIVEAGGVIDSYLAAHYALPITDAVPSQISAVCLDIARYRLYDDHAPEAVRKRYEDAIAWLRLVMDGRIRLALTAPTVDALTGGMAYSVPADDTDSPVFTRLVWS
jgi:phage gp36-like protein